VEALIKAASDVLAAILARLGFVGRPRRRAAIHDDLALLREIEAHPDFGRDSWPHNALLNHIAIEIGKFSGVEFKRRRKIQWGSIALYAIIGAPLGYLTYTLTDDGFVWYAVFPGFVALMMGLATLGMLFAPEPEAPIDAPDESEDRPEAPYEDDPAMASESSSSVGS
jgi:hypothetical protein